MKLVYKVVKEPFLQIHQLLQIRLLQRLYDAQLQVLVQMVALVILARILVHGRHVTLQAATHVTTL